MVTAVDDWTERHTAEVITRGVRTLLSDRVMIDVQVGRDEALRATVVNVVAKELSSLVWVRKESAVTTTTREAIYKLNPFRRWMKPPAERFLETNFYHTCPHIMTNGRETHLQWLSQGKSA